MATVEELKDRVLRCLSAIDDNELFDESRDMPLVVDGIASALDAILPWVPKKAIATIPSGTEVYVLPDDVYDVEAVFDKNAGIIIPMLQLEPGDVFLSDYWLSFPSGSLTFNAALANDCILHYLTYWDKPETEQDLTGDFEPPAVCMTPITYYAAAYVLLPSSVQSAEIRQFNVKADSGNPEHNPIEQSVKFLLALFRQGMDAIPSYQRARG